MVRPYKVKGEKRKKKEENYDKEEIEESVDDESTGSAKRVKTQHTASDTEAAGRVVDVLAGIPVVSTDQSTKPGVIFISTELPWKLLKLESAAATKAEHYCCRLSHSSDKLVDIRDYANGISDDMNLVFVVGEMARGKIEKDYVKDYLSISGYPMSAAYCISMITNVVERKWKIL
ncbi:hypothetical protein KY290_028812 [Solanum tuberosum]|uniref:Nucleolar essential protein n=1 Tax=Solanum tuberosum TaxID=4113 RepID=A0ABQ7UIY6_SOLTU|nr:hypothetical protein KY290_028812 [Solanum tuberosum]